jgi:phytoene/squalene synthetase
MRKGEPPASPRGAAASAPAAAGDQPPADGGGRSPGAVAAAQGIGDRPPANDRTRGVGAPGPGDAPNTLSTARYLAWLYSPAPQQHVFAVLCEIENEIAGSLRPGIDHQVAHARLQWWSEECERCVQGRPAHPLTRELVKTSGTPSRLAEIKGFVDTAVWDLASATFETRKELTAYCERWGAAMFETAAALPAGDNDHATRAADAGAGRPNATAVARGPADAAGVGAEPSKAARVRALGAAVRELELLEGLAREAHVGRLRVPLDELERASVDVHSIAKPPWPAALGTLLSQRHEGLRATIRDSVTALGREEQPRVRGLLVWAALAWRQSVRAQRALPNVIQPGRYHALADGWQAWRAARRAAAGKLRLS